MQNVQMQCSAMNCSPWLSRKIMFTQKVICVRFATDKEQEEDGLPGEGIVDGGDNRWNACN